MLAVLRCAIERYDMIAPGDSIAVGVSGGKDSLALLCLLARLRLFYPKPFALTALTLDPCFGEPMDWSPVASLCNALDVPYIVKAAPFGEILFGVEHKNERPCSLCAKMRRGVLHSLCVEYECNKLALGHHQEDAAETFMMNLLRGGRAECFAPVTYMSHKDIYVIRPLIFALERDVAAFARRNNLPITKINCPVDSATERSKIKDLLADLSHDYGDLSKKITGAMTKGGISGW